MQFPVEFIKLDRWLCFRLDPNPDGGKPKKTPVNARTGRNGSSTNPKTWCDYQTAAAAVEKYGYAGLGFAIVPEDGYVGIDIDHCYNPETGEFSEMAKAVIAKQNTYAEFSPSGDGVHLWYKGTKPAGACRNTKVGLEMYDRDRYLTMTGRPIPGCLDHIAEAEPDTLTWIHETYVALKPEKKKKKKQKSRGVPEKLSDEDILEKAQTASNGDVFSDLIAGKWQDHYPSQSEADMALCMKLAFWSGKDKEQMDRMFRASGLMREKWDQPHHSSGATYGEETIARAIENTEAVYSPGSDSPIFEYEGRYFRTRGDSVYAVTNFIIRPIEMILTEDEAQMTCEFIPKDGEPCTMTFMTTELANQQKFKNLLSKRTISLGWFGGDGDLELFKAFIAQLDWPTKYGVKAAGIYQHAGRYVFATVDGAVDAAGYMVDDLVQLDRYQSIKTGILKTELLTAEKLKDLGKWLLEYNETAKTVSILAWTAGCFVKPHLRMENIKFPHLFLIGEAGSGKSNTMERVILPVFSVDRVTAATQVTAFTLMKESASSNMVPMPLDEFKPSKIDKLKINALFNHFRDSYDGHDGQRGRADMSVNTFKLLAPLVVAGEEAAEEAAIRERSVELLFSKKDVKNPDYRFAFNRLCMNADALGDFGRSLLMTALATESSEVAKWHREGMEKFNKDLPSRVVNNLACCWCGLKLLEKLCASFRLSWDDVFSVRMDPCANYLEFGAHEYLLDGGVNNKSIVEQSFEVMSRMGLRKGIDYDFSDDGATLYIRLTQVYDQYTKYRRDYAVVGEVLPYAQFRKQLTHSDIFIQGNVQRKFNGVNSKCFVIDYQMLSSRCDVSGFEDNNDVIPLN